MPRTQATLLLLHLQELPHAQQRGVALRQVLSALQVFFLHDQLLDVSRVTALSQLFFAHAHDAGEQRRIVVLEHGEEQLFWILLQFLECLHPVLAVEERLLVFLELVRLADGPFATSDAVGASERAGGHLILQFALTELQSSIYRRDPTLVSHVAYSSASQNTYSYNIEITSP